VVGRSAARRGRLERIEVHADEVDEVDLVLGDGRHVRGVVAQREQPRVQPRVQCLHAAAHDLREACEVLDAEHVQARVAEGRRRPTGGDELHAELGQPAGEFHDAGLVGDRQQRPAHADVAGLGHLLPPIPAGR
jgi:hypothetical protein